MSSGALVNFNIAYNGILLYAGQELELLNLKTYTNVDSR